MRPLPVIYSMEGTDIRRSAPPRCVRPGAFVTILLPCLCIGLMLTACRKAEEKKVAVTLPAVMRASPGSRQVETRPIRIAVAAMVSPKETAVSYDAMMRYVGAKLGRPVELIQKRTYEEVNRLLEKRDLDLAFVCAGPYVTGHRKFGMELLVAPLLYGKPYYQAYFIVHRESAVKDMQDLRGGRFAFTDPDSNTGRLVPVYVLSQMGTTPENFFRETIYTYSHDNSIRAVSRKLVDGASVDGLIWDYYHDRNPSFVANTRVIFRSPLYGIPPVVVHPGLPQETKKELKRIFLGMHEDAEGGKILSELRIERFIVPADTSYDSVRNMQAWIEGRQQ